MTDNDREIIAAAGWILECESPFEITHDDGSFASGQAADYVLAALREEYTEDEDEPKHAPAELTELVMEIGRVVLWLYGNANFPASSDVKGAVDSTRDALVAWIQEKEDDRVDP